MYLFRKRILTVLLTATKHSDYIRCDLCRLKFPHTDIGAMEQQAHRGTRECQHRQVEKGKKGSSFQASAVTCE